MNTRDLGNALPTLFAELIDGAPQTEAYMLNGGDVGLLRSLDKLSAIAASALTPNGSSIAAQVDHLRYGLSLMNRWSAGENPFDGADWSASWRKTRVSAVQWKQLREDLVTEAHRWLESLKKPRELDQSELNTVVASVAHLAYHVGDSPDRSLRARSISPRLATTKIRRRVDGGIRVTEAKRLEPPLQCRQRSPAGGARAAMVPRVCQALDARGESLGLTRSAGDTRKHSHAIVIVFRMQLWRRSANVSGTHPSAFS